MAPAVHFVMTFLLVQAVLVAFSQAKRNEKCELTLERGPCTRKLRKWGFDAGRNKCTQFTFSGCKGNRNRFDTRQECEDECGDKCSQPLDRGRCNRNWTRWGYHNGMCVGFNYGGCGGNQNNFRTQGECANSCE